MPGEAAVISGGLQTLGGIAQVAFSGVKKANKNLEAHANSYKPNESIADYYNKSLAKYNPNPYNSLSYQNATNKIQGNLATGISTSQDRRGGLATIGSLVSGANSANANAAAAAEAQSGADLNRLGQAAGMKTREDKVPFDLKYNLLAAKAAAAAKTKSDGLQNIFGGLSTVASGGLFDGKGKGGSSKKGYKEKWEVGDDNTYDS
jgi:hypothetical protein